MIPSFNALKLIVQLYEPFLLGRNCMNRHNMLENNPAKSVANDICEYSNFPSLQILPIKGKWGMKIVRY